MANLMDTQALGRFIRRLEAEGGYSNEQILAAATQWMRDYNAGIRDTGQLESSARLFIEEPKSELLDPWAGEQVPDEITFTEEDIAAAEADLQVPDEVTFTEQDIAAAEEEIAAAEAELAAAQSGEPEMAATPELTLSDPLQMGQALLSADIDALGQDLAAPEEAAEIPALALTDPLQNLQAELSAGIADFGGDLPISNQEAAAQIAARNQRPPAPQQAPAQPPAPQAVPAADTPGYERGWKDWTSLGLGLGGAALGALAPMIERDRRFERALRGRAAGDTIARREAALAAGQLGREIRGASLGRRDLSPALAMRNAQMAAARAGTDVMAQAAIASARERQAAQQQLADIRKARISTQINAGLGALSQTGAWLAGQAAAERQGAKDAAQLRAAQDRNRLQAEQNKLTQQALQGRGKR